MIILKFNKRLGFLLYELLCAFNYLVVLSIIQVLDITFPIYLVFSLIPYISQFKLNNSFSAFLLIYYSTILIISILFNGIWRPTSIFLIRLSGILFFCYIFVNNKYSIIYKKTVLYLSIIFELALAFIATQLSTDGRLMLNYQCTVGCIATSFVLLLSYDLYQRKSLISLIIMILHTFIACLSGTRGYILICLGMTLASIILFATPKQRIIIFLTSLAAICINLKKIIDVFYNTLRFGQSTGIRHAENTFVIRFMLERPILNILFGNGFGSQVKNFEVSDKIILDVSESTYQLYALLIRDGFHNFWLTILYSAGIIGLVLIILLYFNIIKKVRLCNVGAKMKFLLILYLILYAVLLWYRWSATSGVLEFAVLAFILKQIEHETKQEKGKVEL